MSQGIIRQLKRLKHGELMPREEWLKNNRAFLLSQIKNTVSSNPQTTSVSDMWNSLSFVMPRSVVFNLVRPVAILLVVTFMATSGWIAGVDASYNALPGDLLYPAKRAAEKTQLAVASIVGSKKTETQLHVQFAKRRISETKQIIASNDPKKTEKVKETVRDLKLEIASVSQKIEEAKILDSDSMTADAIKDVKQDTDKIKDSLTDVKINLLASTNTSSSAAVNDAINEVKDIVKETSVKAMEVIVTKHLEGDKTVSTEEIKKEINTTLKDVTTDSEKKVQDIKDTKTTTDAQKGDATKNNTVATAVLTKKIDNLIKVIDQVASSTASAVAPTTAISATGTIPTVEKIEVKSEIKTDKK